MHGELLCFFKQENSLQFQVSLSCSGKVNGLHLEILKCIKSTLTRESISLCGFIFILPVFAVFSFSELPFL